MTVMKKLTQAVLILMACSAIPTPVWGQAAAGGGLLTYESDADFSATVERIEPAVTGHGLFLMRVMDHAAAAARFGLELNPSTVALFGNPRVGSQVMTCAPTAGIDLPQKLHVWLGDGGIVMVTFNDPDWLKERHSIEGCDEVLSDVRETLNSIALEVAGISQGDGND